jgi:hypothetical protein
VYASRNPCSLSIVITRFPLVEAALVQGQLGAASSLSTSRLSSQTMNCWRPPTTFEWRRQLCTISHGLLHLLLIGPAALAVASRSVQFEAAVEAAHDCGMHTTRLTGRHRTHSERFRDGAERMLCSRSASTRPRSDLCDPACLARRAARRAIDVPD